MVQLCKMCHNATHTGEINIMGYITTSEGEKIEWNYGRGDESRVHISKNREFGKIN